MPAAFAHAGIFSFLEGLFEKISSARVAAVLESENSQNVALLQAALSVDPNPSKGGGEITVVGASALLPDTGPLGTIADVENEPPSSGEISIYVVRDGDSISQIAGMFGVSINTIIWANDLSRGDIIRPGQTLIILPISGIRHTVKDGDTLASIVKKYKGDIEEIRQFNDIADADKLATGRTIIIPDGELGIVSYRPRVTASNVRGAGGPAYAGYFIRPISGGRTQGLHGWNGVDLAGSHGDPIVAAADGNVIIARPYGWNGGYGLYVVVAHQNGTQTLYAHLSRVIVSQGTSVVGGQVIGYVGSTGRSTGPHLHFEVRGAKNPF